jgi:hypothetical protein
MKKINIYNLIRIQVILLFCFMVYFIVFNFSEKIDLNTFLFAFSLTLPYLVLFCIYNGLCLYFLIRSWKNKLFVYQLPILPLILIYFVSGNKFMIRFWEFSQIEFFVFISIFCFVNGLAYFVYNLDKE